jgi:hypothetical protein
MGNVYKKRFNFARNCFEERVKVYSNMRQERHGNL